MPKLTLKFKNNVIKVYHFAKDKSISVGRRENNDVVISNLTVSGHHAKIDYTGEGFLLTDLKSKNKTYVNEEEVSSVHLNDQDVIGIGKHTLLFSLDQGEHFPEEKENTMDQTMAMNTEAHKEMIKKAMDRVEGQARIGVLGFVEGGKGKIELPGDLSKIGKDSSNEVIIKGFTVPKVAALLKKTPHGYTLTQNSGLTKIKVNNKVVKQTVLLEEFDVIKIGGTELQFFYK